MQAQLIAAYEQLLEQSQRLLEYAKKADWDGIFALKSQGLIDAAYLHRAQDQVDLDASGQQYKLELLSQILRRPRPNHWLPGAGIAGNCWHNPAHSPTPCT